MEQEYKYMVCTSCMTYNHAPYIVDTMNGFTMQETTFPVYYLITDDASTDGEPEVIKQYLADHFQSPYRTEDTDDYYLICAVHKTKPNCTFIVFFLKYNHYSIKKSKLPYQTEWRTNAKYIAMCEGDDYWILPNKLETQVVYMESNQDCGIMYAKAEKISQESNKIIGLVGAKTEGYKELLYHNTIPTLTVLYRNKLRDGYKEIHNKNWMMGDYPLWLFISYRSKCHFWNEVVGVYRFIKESASHSNSYNKQVLFFNSTYEIQRSFIELYGIGDAERLKQNYIQGRFILAYNNNRDKDLRELFPRVRKTAKNVLKYFYKLFQLSIKN